MDGSSSRGECVRAKGRTSWHRSAHCAAHEPRQNENSSEAQMSELYICDGDKCDTGECSLIVACQGRLESQRWDMHLLHEYTSIVDIKHWTVDITYTALI